MYRRAACVPSSPASSVNVTPSSSPVFGPVDSSPPSSPGLGSYSLDSPPHPSVPSSHPFAASTKAIKRLPDYEKRDAESPPCTPPGTFTLRSVGPGLCRAALGPSRSLREDDYLNVPPSPSTSPPSHRTSRYVDREERIWDEALRQPFDTGIGQIDLSNQELKTIPASVGDLAGFFNTPESSEQNLFSARLFARVDTEPTRTRSFERTQSIKDSGKERHVLKLYLMGNMITLLPPELFGVKNLTVLSLRGNRLAFIPPAICHLTNLHELNISNNRLQFLPWQMRDMKIEKLMVNPNPFLPEPSDPPAALAPTIPPALRPRRSISRLYSLRKAAALAAASGGAKPVLSPITLSLARVPPLTELSLRLLLAPPPSLSEASQSPRKMTEETVLATYYALPLSDQWNIPPNVRRTLVEAVPGVLAVRRPRKRFSVDVDTLALEGGADTVGVRGCAESAETGACPNPAHRGRVFVRHASERFSWERRIAGVDVGGAVPLRWRGCLTTCLDFLGDESSDRPASLPGAMHGHRLSPPLQTAQGAERDVGVDIDMGLAVQAVDLGSISLDMDGEEGFDDA